MVDQNRFAKKWICINKLNYLFEMSYNTAKELRAEATLAGTCPSLAPECHHETSISLIKFHVNTAAPTFSAFLEHFSSRLVPFYETCTCQSWHKGAITHHHFLPFYGSKSDREKRISMNKSSPNRRMQL